MKSFFVLIFIPIILFSQWKDFDVNSKKKLLENKIFLITIDDSRTSYNYKDLIFSGLPDSLNGYVPIYEDLDVLKIGFSYRLWSNNAACFFEPGNFGSIYPFLFHVDDNIKKVLIPSFSNDMLDVSQGYCALDYGDGTIGQTLIPVMLFTDKQINNFVELLKMLGELDSPNNLSLKNLKKTHDFLMNLVTIYDQSSNFNKNNRYRKKSKQFEKNYNRLTIGDVWNTCFGYQMNNKKINKLKIKDINSGKRKNRLKKLEDLTPLFKDSKLFINSYNNDKIKISSFDSFFELDFTNYFFIPIKDLPISPNFN